MLETIEKLKTLSSSNETVSQVACAWAIMIDDWKFGGEEWKETYYRAWARASDKIVWW